MNVVQSDEKKEKAHIPICDYISNDEEQTLINPNSGTGNVRSINCHRFIDMHTYNKYMYIYVYMYSIYIYLPDCDYASVVIILSGIRF